MRKTYVQKFHDDFDAIDAETLGDMPLLNMQAERAGRFRALAAFYAGCADFHAAKEQVNFSDPTVLAKAVIATAPSPGFLAEFLSCLVGGLATQDDITQEIISAIENAADACHEEASAINRREEDLDAPAAAKSDERYSRMVDDGLIGRSALAPEAA